MPSTADVVEALVAERAGIVRMAGTGKLRDVAVILRMGVAVIYERSNWSTGGIPVIDARQNGGHIGVQTSG